MPYVAPQSPAHSTPAESTERRPIVVWDIVLTSVLILLSVGLAWLLGILGIFLAVTQCSADCSGLTIGATVATFAPAAAVLISTIVAIIRMVRRRRAFWVPIIGMAAAVLMTVLGGTIAFLSLG